MASQAKSAATKKRPRGSCLRTILELSLFGIWLTITGLAGYFIGTAPTPACIPVSIATTQDAFAQPASTKCIETSELDDHNGLSYEQIQHAWSCKNTGNATMFNTHVLPSDGSMSDTKWESILAVDPNKFFDMYLSQYPGDTRAVQPVIIFSHKPLESLEELPEVCKVLDIAIVPDSPGVCVAVTETFHDVASYHMLHADRKDDGTFSLTSNYLEGRNLPNNEQYALAREILAEYFRHADLISGITKRAVAKLLNVNPLGCVVESLEDLTLVQNSILFAHKAGISSKEIILFTSNSDVLREARSLSSSCTVVDISQIEGVGKSLSPIMRRHFLQAWLAFSVSDNGVRMVWQSPGTIWLANVAEVLSPEPKVELLFAFKGRNDKRAAPFFVSFDLFVPSGSERPVHLMHELMLHFDLILAWDSLDAVASYRLSENNAR
jgi:hypothetical protein